MARTDIPGALADAQAALAIRGAPAAADPGDLEVQLGLADSWDRLSRIAIRNNDGATARAAADKHLEIAARVVEHDPDNAGWGRVLMFAYQRRAEAEEQDEHDDAAVTASRKAIAAAQRLVELDPDNLERRAEWLHLRGKLASYLTYGHHTAEALAILTADLPAAEALAARVPASAEYARWVGVLHEYTGDVRYDQKQPAEAAAAYGRRLVIDRRLAAAHPEVTVYQMTVPVTQFLVGDVLADIPERHAEGIATMEDALAQLRALRDAGKLSKEAIAGIAAREAELAGKRK